jgi:hypothetical protein
MAAAKKKKRSLFCAALVAGTINKLEQSIFAPSISMCKSHDRKAHIRCLCRKTIVFCHRCLINTGVEK